MPQDRAIGRSHCRTLMLAALLAFVPQARSDDRMQRGLDAYETGRYAQALTEFQGAAELDNARAQEILGFMHLQGPSLYGAAVPHDRAKALYWFGRAARQGREVAQHMTCVLSGRPAATVVNRASCTGGTQASVIAR